MRIVLRTFFQNPLKLSGYPPMIKSRSRGKCWTTFIVRIKRQGRTNLPMINYTFIRYVGVSEGHNNFTFDYNQHCVLMFYCDLLMSIVGIAMYTHHPHISILWGIIHLKYSQAKLNSYVCALVCGVIILKIYI